MAAWRSRALSSAGPELPRKSPPASSTTSFIVFLPGYSLCSAAGSGPVGPSEPLKPVCLNPTCAARTASSAGCPTSGPARWATARVVAGKKALVIPIAASVFSMEAAPSGSIPLKARMQSTVSGTTVARPVPGAHLLGGAVHHHVHLPQQIVEFPGDRDAG